MIGWKMRFRLRWGHCRVGLAVAALLVAAVLAAGLTELSASNQRVLSVTAFPTAISARDGESTITVRIPAAAAGGDDRVQLSTELGAFTAASGPPGISAVLSDVGNDTLGASVRLVADGRVGASVVTARVGSLVDTVTVRFVGDAAELRLVSPSDDASLDASRSHQIRIEATDSAGARVPSAAVTMELLAAPVGAMLRSGADSSEAMLQVTTSQNGEAGVSLSSAPGDVIMEARSGDASLTAEFRFYGSPTTLRIVPIAESVIERGTIGEPRSLQVLLLDDRAQGVPSGRIHFQAEGGLAAAADGDGESLVTDDSGRARVHLDASNANLGLRTLTASWTSGEVTLSDQMEILVTGPPAALYLVAEALPPEADGGLIEQIARRTRYRVTAEVVDALGQPVSGAYQVRWRPLVTDTPAHVDPVQSVTEGGSASAIFSIEHAEGAPSVEATRVEAWLVSKAQVNDRGLIADLLGDGVPLRASWNYIVWRGPDARISEIIEPIQHVVSSAWRKTEAGWQAWFTADVPGAVDFTLTSGDSVQLVLTSAARLPDVERR